MMNLTRQCVRMCWREHVNVMWKFLRRRYLLIFSVPIVVIHTVHASTLYTRICVSHLQMRCICWAMIHRSVSGKWCQNTCVYTIFTHPHPHPPTHTHRPIPMPTNTHIYAHKECHQFKISSQIMALASAICCSVDGVRCAAIAAAVVDNVDQSL